MSASGTSARITSAALARVSASYGRHQAPPRLSRQGYGHLTLGFGRSRAWSGVSRNRPAQIIKGRVAGNLNIGSESLSAFSGETQQEPQPAGEVLDELLGRARMQGGSRVELDANIPPMPPSC